MFGGVRLHALRWSEFSVFPSAWAKWWLLLTSLIKIFVYALLMSAAVVCRGRTTGLLPFHWHWFWGFLFVFILITESSWHCNKTYHISGPGVTVVMLVAAVWWCFNVSLGGFLLELHYMNISEMRTELFKPFFFFVPECNLKLRLQWTVSSLPFKLQKIGISMI